MRGRTGGMALAAITSIVLVASACGGGGTEPQPGTSQAGSARRAERSPLPGCTPENPLIPANTSEACGGDMIDAMTSKLVRYNAENAAPENDIAESIETKDNQHFTVKLKPYKFHDGTDVKAKNFVDAWNYTAYAPNGQADSYFFAPVAGLRRRRSAAPTQDCKDKPARPRPCRASRSSTTHLHDQDHRPVSNLPVRLGYYGIRATAGLLLRRSQGLRGEADRRRAVQAGLQAATPSTCVSKFADYSGATSRTWTR